MDRHDVSLQRIAAGLQLAESEETWDRIAKALDELKGVVQHTSAEEPQYAVQLLRSHAQAINSAISSDRSRLSGAAIDVVAVSATELSRSFDPLLTVFISPLLSLCIRTSKVFLNRARACLNSVVASTQSPSILPLLVTNMKDKSVSLRLTVAEVAATFLNSVNPPDIQRDARAKEIETLIKAAATDANADVRKYGRQLFESYKILLPHRVDSFTAPLTPTVRKYLDLRGVSAQSSMPTSRPASAMSTLSASSSCDTTARPDSVHSRKADVPSPTPQPDFEPRRSRSKATSNHKTISRNGPSEAQRPLATRATSVADVQRPDSQREKQLNPSSSSSMPPPDFVPLRPRSNSAASASEPSHVRQARAGPLRPGPSVPDPGAVLFLDDAAQKRAGGPRRVLRPEVPAPQPAEKPPVTKGPVRPDSRNSDRPVSSGIHQVTSASNTAHDSVPKSNEPAVLDKRSIQSRSANKSSKSHESNAEDHRHASDRLSKPTMSQMARMKPSVATTRKREETKRVTKASSLVKAAPCKKPNTSNTCPKPPTSRSNSSPTSDVRAAAAIALPASPTGPQPTQKETTADDETEVIEEEPSGSADEPAAVPATAPSIMPSTPPNKSSRAFQVEQTPISALFESIREGFVFTPGLPPLELGEEYEEMDCGSDFVAVPANPVHVAPLTWGQKAMPES